MLSTDALTRKNIPLARGLLDYFPDALAEVAELSRIGNEQHNPGQPMHWAKEKSTDHADSLMRHLMDRGKLDTDRVRHSTKVAWRALANLQIEIEAERAPALPGLPAGAPLRNPPRDPHDLTDIPPQEKKPPVFNEAGPAVNWESQAYREYPHFDR